MTDIRKITAITDVLKNGGDDIYSQTRVLFDFFDFSTPNVSSETIVNSYPKPLSKSPEILHTPRNLEEFKSLRSMELSSFAALNSDIHVVINPTNTSGVRSLVDTQTTLSKVNPNNTMTMRK
jgi:hypothetical protein